MAPLATTRTIVRRFADPDRPRIAVASMVAVSLLLLGAVLVALPSPAQGSDDAPVISVPEAPLDDGRLIDAAGEVVLPQPDEDVHQGSTLVNLRRDGVTVDAAMANGEGLSVELEEEGELTVRAVVTSDTVHRCGHYAGTLILTASHAELPDDVLLLDVLFAECPDTEAPTLAGGSVNDVSPTWAEGGRAPWRSSAPSSPQPPPPPPPAPEPPPPAPAPAEPATAAPEQEPAPEQPAPEQPAPEQDAPEQEPAQDPEPEQAPAPDPEPQDEQPQPDPPATTEASASGDDTAGEDTDGQGDGGSPDATASPAETSSSEG